jgi:hypothetical protein
MIQINQPTRCNSFTSLLLDVYVWLNMFRAPRSPSSGAWNCTRSLWFYRWSLAVGALLVVVWLTPDHQQKCTFETVPSCWLFYFSRMIMHSLANVQIVMIFTNIFICYPPESLQNHIILRDA